MMIKMSMWYSVSSVIESLMSSIYLVLNVYRAIDKEAPRKTSLMKSNDRFHYQETVHFRAYFIVTIIAIKPDLR